MKNRLKKIAPSLLAVLLVFLVLPDSKGVAFRWKHKIVSIGDTTVDVLNKCGDPSFREVVGTEAKGRSFKWTDEGEEDGDLDITRKHYSEIYLKVERWYYDFGSHKFIRILTFRGGILKKIETGDYGGADWDFTEAKDQETDKPGDTVIYGAISVVGSPYGAKVYLNDQFAGNIPCRLEHMEPGAHNVVISSKGYKDRAKRLTVRAGRTSYLNVYLEPDKPGAKKTVTDESDKVDAPSIPSRKVYMWTDENGHIHITDIPPPAAPR